MSYDYYGVNWSPSLSHHGVKGQKWGVRRKRPKSSSTKSVKKNHPDYERAHSKKRVSEMSDAELRSVVNRLTLENNYIEQMSKQKSDGQRALNKIFKQLETGTKYYDTANRVFKIATKAFL